MAGSNKTIHEFDPNGTLQLSFEIGIWNDILNKTEKTNLGALSALNVPSQNFEWVTDNGAGYDIDEFVTYQGKAYQSLVNLNLNNTPGVDPTKWVLVNKSNSGFVFWVAGVFLQAKAFVISEHKGYADIYLLTVAAPYNSVDIVAEELAGDWVALISPLSRKNATVGSHTVALDFTADLSNIFVIGAVGETKTWSVTNGGRAVEFKGTFTLSGTDAQTFPANFNLKNDLRYDPSTHVWYPSLVGKYSIKGFYDGTEWIVEIDQQPI